MVTKSTTSSSFTLPPFSGFSFFLHPAARTVVEEQGSFDFPSLGADLDSKQPEDKPISAYRDAMERAQMEAEAAEVRKLALSQMHIPPHSHHTFSSLVFSPFSRSCRTASLSTLSCTPSHAHPLTRQAAKRAEEEAKATAKREKKQKKKKGEVAVAAPERGKEVSNADLQRENRSEG